MQRCENCGLRLEDPKNPDATLCPGCAYRRNKEARRVVQAGGAPATPPPPAAAPDLDALRERLRQVEETLRQPDAPPG